MPIASSEPPSTASAMVSPGFTDKPIRWFDSAVPPDFLRLTIEMLFESYEAKDRYLPRVAPAEQHDLWPVYRRAVIEGQWRRLARECGLHASPELNAGLNAYHTEVQSGLIVITQSYVSDRAYLPQPAEFRRTLTQTCQGKLFFAADDKPEPGGRIYAILTHGQWGEDPTQPGFADLLFPAMEDGRVVIANRIRLFEDRFPEQVSALRAARAPVEQVQEVIPDDIKIAFREREGSSE